MRVLPTPIGPDPTGQPADSDAALIGTSCSRPQAFAAIFDRHAEELYRYVVGRIGAQAAADVVAEVFVVAFRNRDRYDRDRPDARPWLYGIATRLVGRHRREERRRLRALARIAAPGAVEGFEEHATDRVMAQQLHPRLTKALRHLSAADRDLLLLVAWGELTYQQAGQVLGDPNRHRGFPAAPNPAEAAQRARRRRSLIECASPSVSSSPLSTGAEHG